MTVYSKLVFPFRAMSFFSLYLAINTIFYNRNNVFRNYLWNRAQYADISTPNLPKNILQNLRDNASGFPDGASYKNTIFRWSIAADILLVFLFACMILGFLTNKAFITFVIGSLHFIGVILCTFLVIEYASPNFLICAIAFGVIFPALIEIVNLISILAFKTDFYVQSK